jgi:polysaccharide export outer membrane protein
MRVLLTGLSFALYMMVNGGCASTTQVPVLQKDALSVASNQPSSVFHPHHDVLPVAPPASDEQVALERLSLLWQQRAQEETLADYPLGSGDVLEISVPEMEELANRTVRVAGDGTIALPFLGIVPAGGLTERALREELWHLLKKYMHSPQVNLFVREYRSRQVAVTGAVEKPGLYNLASGKDTLLDMISLAGGLTKEAAPRLLFLPAESSVNDNVQLASLQSVTAGGTSHAPFDLQRADPIVIDLKSLSKGNSQVYLTVPARPGDVLFVPGGGEVVVGGWVENPGSYKITSGLTVLGAVSAAGGLRFPANTSAVKILRTGRQGEKAILIADLGKIEDGEGPDIPLQEGDVVEVASSTPKLVSYGVFNFFRSVVNVGTYLKP